MMMKKIILLSLYAAQAFSQQIVHDRQLVDHRFTQTVACGLERFSVATFDYEFRNLGGSLNTSRNGSMAAVWSTSNPSCLKDYGVVQFIRGCVYDIERDPKTGNLHKYFGHSRESRGKIVKFQHRTWEVDSVDLDPMYSSYSEADANEAKRFEWHKSTKIPFTLAPDDVSLAQDQKIFFNRTNYDFLFELSIPVNQVFITDIPTGSSYNPNGGQGKEWITQSSLEFKTCVYHVRDIPMLGDPASFDTPENEGGPITCVDWSMKTEPDYQKKSFSQTAVLDPYCLR